MSNSETGYFEEIQKFRQPWLLAPLGLLSAMIWVMTGLQVLGGKQIGNNPAPDFVMILMWVLIGIGMPLFFWFLQLKTRVGPEGLTFQFFLLHFKAKRYRFDEIESCESVTFRPILEYGGWGIRYNGTEWAYTVSGARGVRIKFKNGKQILIGSQKPDDLARAIKKFKG